MPLNIAGREYFTMDDIAAETGIGIRTVRTYVSTGKMKAVKVGTRYLVLKEDYLRMFDMGTSKPVKFHRNQSMV